MKKKKTKPIKRILYTAADLRKAHKIGKMDGLREGESKFKRMLQNMKATNRELFNLTRVLEDECPLSGIFIRMDDAEHIARCLSEGVKNESHADYLFKQINEKNDELQIDFDKLLRKLKRN